jgi:hypothetical protein
MKTPPVGAQGLRPWEDFWKIVSQMVGYFEGH